QVVTAHDITGQIYFRVAYDDTAGTIMSSFSLDGGRTFQSPFSPAPIMTQGRDYAQYILGADPRVSAAASTTTTTTSPASTTTTTFPPGPCARLACEQGVKSRLDLRAGPKGQLLHWVSSHDATGSPPDLGNPLPGGDTGYTVCMRHGTGPLFYEHYLGPGGRWKTAKTGFKYATDPIALLVKSSAGGRSRVLVRI